MRYNFVNLRAFGHFTDYELILSRHTNFHFFYGPNEAGKSTVLRAFSNFLYGFPQQTGDSFLHENKKLLIEGELEKEDGETLHFFRRKGRKNTVLDSENLTIDEQEVNRFLKGLSQDYFQTMFALDHVRLREGGESLLQGDGDAGESLFSAASGVSSLRETARELENHAKTLYLKSGQKPVINKLLREERGLVKEISGSQLKVREWRDLQEKYEKEAREIDELSAALKRYDRDVKKLERILQLLPKAARWHHLSVQIENLGSLPELPENAGSLRENLTQSLAKSKQRIVSLDGTLNRLREEIETVHVPEDLLTKEEAITALYRKCEKYADEISELPRLEEMLRQRKDQLMAGLQDVIPDASDLDEIKRLRLSADQKQNIRSLAGEKTDIHRKVTNLIRETEALQQEISDYEAQLDEAGNPGDADELQAFFAQLSREGNVEKERQQTERKLSLINEEIAGSATSLPLWDGTIDELADFRTPLLNESIKLEGQKKARLESERRETADQLKKSEETVRQLEKQIKDLESASEIPSREDLFHEREHRDRGWLFIRKILQSGKEASDDHDVDLYTKGLPLELAYEKSVAAADQTADLMQREAEKVGKKAQLVSALEAAKDDTEELRQQYEESRINLEKWQDAWESSWEESGISPLSPEEMSEWTSRLDEIFSLFKERRMLAEQLSELTDAAQKQRKRLATILTIDDELSFSDLLSEAEIELKTRVEAARKIQSIQDAQQKAVRLLTIKKNDLETARSDAAEWEQAWEKAVEELPVRVTTNPGIVTELLHTYDQLLEGYSDCRQLELDLHSLKERIQRFEEGVESAADPDQYSFEEGQYDKVVHVLQNQLKAGLEAKQQLIHLREQEAAYEQERLIEKESLTEAETEFERLLAAGNCESAEELIKIERQCREKTQLTGERDAVEGQMLTIGNGLSLEKLLEETEEIEADDITLRLEELKAERERLDLRKQEQLQSYGVLKQEYMAATEGASSEAAALEAEKQTIYAQIERAADEYLTSKLASVILKRGIDAFREQNQSPIINRASSLFARLTLGSFKGITIEFNEQDKPVLAGLRQDGSSVAVSGMSDGTTDQLYLALRIASIEKYTEENEPVPFIVDDILVHFDDDRSRETLSVLLELSKTTQVVFFSHHERLKSLLAEAAQDRSYQSEAITGSPVYAD
ncbi:hypothetical protein CR205_06365 [Alteribacter lacisalsi]|uniref:YhaN AAA domain-containing protein n=1 Tax=Alteribacter lacisalsi TaxID=2045244 RepID=A0A2W0HL11_9BACI|nr:YhaN family protein [Alteribacter lacisalsi]PYZ98215.1 hypothetical protein CR205_06365 [Alteribacter lacisalsi]